MNAVEQRSAILDKAEQIARLIQESEEMNRFSQAKNKIENHADANVLTFLAKAKRNHYSKTSLRLGYDHPESIKAKQEYDEVLHKISAIPIMDEFKEAQDEINDIMQGVLKTIVSTVSDVLSVEKTEEPGDSASGGCGSCSSGGCGKH